MRCDSAPVNHQLLFASATLALSLWAGNLAGNLTPFPADAVAPVSSAEPIRQPYAPSIPRLPAPYSAFRADLVTITFANHIPVTLAGNTLTDNNTGLLDPIKPILADLAARGAEFSRLYPKLSTEKLSAIHATAQANLGKTLPNPNRKFMLTLPKDADSLAICKALLASAIVVHAEPFALPVVPPGSGGASFPDYGFRQTYFGPQSGGGINLRAVNNDLNYRGQGIFIADLEYDMNFDHLDLPGVTLLSSPYTPPFDPEHGTAVVGMMGAIENSAGITGGATDAGYLFEPTVQDNIWNVGASVLTAVNTLNFGDIILIEQQYPGPNYVFDPNNPGSQNGLIPVEWRRDWYDAIVLAVGNGISVIQTAGNGGQNLDSPIYNTGNGGHYPFQLANNSGSIIVGAGVEPGRPSPARSRYWYSNFGSRLDVQGWGGGVTTTGYGDLFNASVNERFTATFGGTSGATPMVVSVAAAMSQAYSQARGFATPPAVIRNILRNAGLPQTSAPGIPSTERIGSLPDAYQAVAAALLAVSANPFKGQINIDFDQPTPSSSGSGTPSQSFAGAAGNNISWTSLAPPYGDFVRYTLSTSQGTGNTPELFMTSAFNSQSTAFDWPGSSGDQARLLDDGVRGVGRLTIGPMAQGTYDVYTYITAPVGAGIGMEVLINNDFQIVSGDISIPGLERTRTHSLHRVAIKLQSQPIIIDLADLSDGTAAVAGVQVRPACLADVGSQGGLPEPDNQLNNNDFAAFITLFFEQNAMADVGSQGGIIGSDSLFDNNDFAAFITLFFQGC
jgi:serine protease